MHPILTTGLTKRYGSFTAVAKLDLEVHAGEVFGFLGPNGAGKSTLIRTLMGELRPSAGRALVLGSSPRDVSARKRLGYLPADLALWPAMTGHETLRFLSRLRRRDDTGATTRFAAELAERLGADLDKRVGELSTGNRQKIGLISAFMHRPALVILDEPNAGLDPLVQHEFWAMMREVADDGRTVFLSSHTLAEVERVADRVGIIRQGSLVAVESVSALRGRQMRRIEIDFAGVLTEADLSALPGVQDLVLHPDRAELNFVGELAELLDAVMRRVRLRDIHTQEAELEDVFLSYYRDQQ